MDDSSILKALKRLGEIGVKARLILAGGAVPILSGHSARFTEDVDVIASVPKLSEFADAIARVAKDLDLPENWLNDSARAWIDYLPSDFIERTDRIAGFGELEVLAISRKDLILLKLVGLRAQDLEDVAAFEPTRQELEFVNSQLDRIAAFDESAALRVGLYLRQGAREDHD